MTFSLLCYQLWDNNDTHPYSHWMMFYICKTERPDLRRRHPKMCLSWGSVIRRAPTPQMLLPRRIPLSFHRSTCSCWRRTTAVAFATVYDRGNREQVPGADPAGPVNSNEAASHVFSGERESGSLVEGSKSALACTHTFWWIDPRNTNALLLTISFSQEPRSADADFSSGSLHNWTVSLCLFYFLNSVPKSLCQSTATCLPQYSLRIEKHKLE